MMTTSMPLDSHDDEARLKAHLHQMAEEQFRRQMRQASMLLSAGNAKDAIPLLERCFDLHPDDVNVLMNLGGAYILAGKHQRAVPVLESASELAPDNPNVWTNLAAAYLGKLVTSTHARQENALAAYQRVIEIDAAYPNVHYNMGLIYIDRRDWQAALTRSRARSKSIPTMKTRRRCAAGLKRSSTARPIPEELTTAKHRHGSR